MEFICIIPARYASTRFPGKPLAMIGGKTMIERVYTRARMAIDDVIVATDDSRIARAVEAFGGRAVMTSPDHRSGTDRCYEAYCLSGSDADVVINIQGDEALYRSSADPYAAGVLRLARDRHRHAHPALRPAAGLRRALRSKHSEK